MGQEARLQFWQEPGWLWGGVRLGVPGAQEGDMGTTTRARSLPASWANPLRKPFTYPGWAGGKYHRRQSSILIAKFYSGIDIFPLNPMGTGVTCSKAWQPTLA